MKVKINHKKCSLCGLCGKSFPRVFGLRKGRVYVKRIEGFEEQIRIAANECPMQAICIGGLEDD